MENFWSKFFYHLIPHLDFPQVETDEIPGSVDWKIISFKETVPRNQ